MPPRSDGLTAMAKVPRYAVLTAAIILVVYLGLTFIMIFALSKYPNDDPRWTHALLIYNGFMSFATAAAGLLLGTQIQQGAVEASQKDAADAKASEQTTKQAIHDVLDLWPGTFTEAGGAQPSADALAELHRRLLRAVR